MNPALGGARVRLDEATLRALRCPSCGGELQASTRGSGCSACSVSYPDVGNVPCLVPDPLLFRARWRLGFDEYRSFTESQLGALRLEASAQGLPERVRERLRRVASALEARSSVIERELRKLELAETPALPSAVRASVPAVLKCYENVFRDWAWGDEECEIGLSLFARLADGPLGRVAVYGAGAARLAADVHRSLTPELTFALDNNPFPLLLGSELLRGVRVTLPEFPVAPVSDRDVVVERELACRAPVGAGLVLLFADALRPPFAPGSLDTVLTPWFIDAVNAELGATLTAINQALRRGGDWLNVGPLRFDGALSRSYVVEDVREIAERCGFSFTASFEASVPYLNSPASGSRQFELVQCFSARKVRDAVPMAPTRRKAWLEDASQPIAVTPGMSALQSSAVFTAAVLAMVDGRRSIRDLARVLGSEWRTDPRAIEPRLCAFFERLSSVEPEA